jgi:glutamyl-Q tRNA(Asp) synthetase
MGESSSNAGMSGAGPYVGRFAPSPTGLLHAGSLVAALASWLDARAHGGRWLVRIEDTDTPRCVPGAGEGILRQLAACGLVPDEPPAWQSARGERYAQALETLKRSGWAYPCTCSRSDIAAALARAGVPQLAHVERVYPGTCRPPGFAPTDGPPALPLKRTPAWRVRTHDRAGAYIVIDWHDRLLGAQQQDVATAVGDFVLLRADGLWAYQLAVVVDDGAQGVTDVVRGADLADNTARQIHLQRLLGLPTPRYQHTPLVYADDGQKLSKQTGAKALALRSDIEAVAALRRAARVLGLPEALHDGSDGAETPARWLPGAVQAWGHHLRAVGGMIASLAPPPASPAPHPARTNTMTITTASGLKYEDTQKGSGDVAASGQSVTVHYTGWLHDPAKADGRGIKFDSSHDRRDPFVFALGAGMVIRGWDEGVQGMAVGGTRVLTIPPDLGYGARGAGGVIPPNATLVFEVTLLATK